MSCRFQKVYTFAIPVPKKKSSASISPGASIGELSVTLHEEGSHEYGSYTWASAKVLAEFCIQMRELIIGKTVCELGAGTGLVGIVAAKLGASLVFLTDKREPVHLVDRIKDNTIANDVQSICQPFVLEWGKFDEQMMMLPTFDLILGADVFFDEEVFQDLVETVAYLLYKSYAAEFWTTYQQRNENWTIEPHLRYWGLDATIIPFDSSDGSESEIYLMRIKKKSPFTAM